MTQPLPYRGRLAPSPTGWLHLGHARTFWIAQQRAQARRGTLILRNEDLDADRCRPEFATAMIEDMKWFGLRWQEGPDCGGPHGPYDQSQRRARYLAALEALCRGGHCYPCTCSRKTIRETAPPPRPPDQEPVYAGTCRPQSPPDDAQIRRWLSDRSWPRPQRGPDPSVPRVTWRFRVPTGQLLQFQDHNLGPQTIRPGKDFGDFVLWRHEDLAAYQLAVVVDDAAMGVTEVVRGEDLLESTGRQWLLYEALGLRPPGFFHCALVTDEAGVRLAKRHDSLSLREFKARGVSPGELRRRLGFTGG
jgi:glutamyl-tRNA synthetase